MTRIIAPFADLGPRNAADQPHQKLLTPEYVNNLATALKAKFQGAIFQVYESGMISFKGRYFSNILAIKPELNLTFDVRLDGQIHDDMGTIFQPFVATKVVFPDDDPAELADWAFLETQRKMREIESRRR